MTIRLTLVALAIGTASSLYAQRPLSPGDRIRLSYAPLDPDVIERVPRSVVGIFARLRGDSVYATSGTLRDTMVFAVRHLARVDVSTSTYSPVVKGGALGAAFGGVAGVTYGYLRASGPQTLCYGVCPKVTASERARNAGRVGLLGIAGGAVFGLLIGKSITTDRWERVNLSLQVQTGP